MMLQAALRYNNATMLCRGIGSEASNIFREIHPHRRQRTVTYDNASAHFKVWWRYSQGDVFRCKSHIQYSRSRNQLIQRYHTSILSHAQLTKGSICQQISARQHDMPSVRWPLAWDCRWLWDSCVL